MRFFIISTLILALIMGGVIAAIDSADVVLWLDMQEGAGNPADSSANGNDGTLNAGAGGWVGSGGLTNLPKYIEFDAANTYIDVGNDSSLNPDGDSFIWSAWINTPTSGASGTLWEKGATGVNPLYYTDFNSNKASTVLEGASNQISAITSTATFNTDAWTHIAVIYKYNDWIAYCVNGAIDNNASVSAAVGAINPDEKLYIGTRGSAGFVNDYNGNMTGVVFARGLYNCADAAELYNGGDGITYAGYFGSNNFTISATNIYNSSSLSGFSATITWNGSTWTTNSTGATLTTNISQDSGLANITISADNYFTNYTLNHDTVANLDQTMTPWTAVYAIDNNTGTNLENYTITYNGTDYTTNNSVAYVPLYSVTNAVLEFDGLGDYTNENASVNASDYLQNYTFNVYPDPSVVDVTIYDADAGTLITENITLVVSGASYEETFNTLTGSIYVGNLTSGIYTFKFSGANYSTQTYTLTVGTNTYQELNAWLSSNTSDLRFILRDWDSGEILEDVTVVMQRVINSTWTTVESKDTDITGRALFQFVEGVRYRFTVTKTGYDSRTFELDPIDPTIAEDGYTVRMRKTTTQTDPTNFAEVSLSITPKRYSIGNQTVNYTLFSPDGALSSYGILVTIPGGSNSSIGTSPYGEELLTGIEISSVTLGDTINITYWYDHTIYGNRSYSLSYFIDINASAYTWAGVRNTDYGFTTFEKALIATAVTIVIAGIAFYFAGILGGAVVGILMLGLFYYMQFFTLWMVLPGMFAGIVLLIWRATS